PIASPLLACLTTFVPCSAPRPDPHSFPTRRSSDLSVQRVGDGRLDDHRANHPGPRSADVIGVDLAEVCERPRGEEGVREGGAGKDRKSTRLNSSHGSISYAVFCLKKKTEFRI